MFHCKDGWFFERYPKGGVAIIKRESANEQSPIVASIICTPEEWASVVASVSARGEGNRRWYVALDFHSGLTPDAADDGEAEAKSEAFAKVVKMVGNKDFKKPHRR